MRLQAVVTVAVLGLSFAGLGSPPAQAQDAAPAQPKGVTAKGLISSTGTIARIPVTAPIVLTGQVIQIDSGGQTGKQRFLVPTYLYVLEGVLTIDTEGGPTGVSGIQYHATGHSYATPIGLWHNIMNNGQAPARFLLLYVGTPGGPTTEQAKADD